MNPNTYWIIMGFVWSMLGYIFIAFTKFTFHCYVNRKRAIPFQRTKWMVFGLISFLLFMLILIVTIGSKTRIIDGIIYSLVFGFMLTLAAKYSIGIFKETLSPPRQRRNTHEIKR